MDRSVLLVDAGYLFAQGGLACHGTKARKSLVLDANALVDGLTAAIVEHSGIPLLRTYWYDGAQRGLPTAAHQRVSLVPYVKLRLGRVSSSNQQKGVDALIYRDLMTLASERSVAQAYLLSGDDDLREGVMFAQDRGIRVILLGIAHKGRTNQSQELLSEADDRMTVDMTNLRRCLTLAPVQPELQLGDAPAEPFAVGKSYGSSWLEAATEEALLTLRAGRPVIPGTLDVDLIRSCEVVLGRTLRGDDTTKREIRRGFWHAIAPENDQPSSA